MKQPFTDLTKEDVQKLRKKPMAVLPQKFINYNFTKKDIDDAVKHLKTLYTANVTSTFASKILLNNRIY